MTAGSGANIASNLAGPSYVATARLDAASRPATPATSGAAQPARPEVEEARRQFAYVMLSSFIAFLLGAGAAYAAGRYTTARTMRVAAEPLT
jgi:hypothetical protein